MTYDVARVRCWFPAVAAGPARFDGPGGSQTPRQVADAVAATMVSGIGNRGADRFGVRAERTVADARAALGDLLGADPRGVVFGRSMTELTFHLARTLARSADAGWGPGDEVVVTRLDHDANIRPWVRAAESVGATVRWADPDPVTGELPVEAVLDLLGPRTRLVALTGASNLIGTRPDVPAVTRAVRDAGALSFVDGVHLTPHAPVDVAALGADFFACSPYKFLGPHLGAVVASPALLETLRPDKLLPSADSVPERFELGTAPFEALAGVTAAVDVLADLVPTDGSRRHRLTVSMTALEEHEAGLLQRLLGGLADLAVTLHGDPARRTPTVLLTVPGREPAAVAAALAEAGVIAPAGSFYALELARHLGLGDAGGVRVGLAAYTDAADVDRLLEALAGLA